MKYLVFILCFAISNCYNYDCKPCKCLIEDQQIIANCNSDEKIELLQEIPKIIDAKANIIKFEGQILTHFKKGELFKFVNLTQCYFSNNKISEIANGTFSSLKKLTRVDLSHNLISTLDFFDEETNLEVLDLGNNKLQVLHETSLYYLSNLIELHLENNLIESIEPNAFNNLKKISVIDLSNNKLQQLDLPETTTLQQFILHDNLWNCSFSTCRLREACIHNQWLTIIPTCSNPPNYKNLKWTQLYEFKPVITVHNTECSLDLICTFESCPTKWNVQEITDIDYDGFKTILHLPNKAKYNGNYTCSVDNITTYNSALIKVGLSDSTTTDYSTESTTDSNQNEDSNSIFNWPDLSISFSLILIIILVVICCGIFCLKTLTNTLKCCINCCCCCCALSVRACFFNIFRHCGSEFEDKKTNDEEIELRNSDSYK